jgi:ectoine hydroxylase-related dioxygenase (phytanoyl-CoA dioxygenase family)
MTSSTIEEFDKNGFAVFPGFYDRQTEIAPIQERIRRIVKVVADKYGVAASTMTPEVAMTTGWIQVAAANRSWGGEIYDAVKQIPEFVSLAASAKNTRLFETLRRGSVPGFATAGCGIRIDAPGEHKYRAMWHQEFPAQMYSLDGLVFWSPLLPMTAEMGPVELAIGSHREGLVPVFEDDEGIGRTGAYALRLEREAERIAQYQRAAPLTAPGDLVVLDFLLLHQSGKNLSTHPRWSMQFRMFNFLDPVGTRLSWRGGMGSKDQISQIAEETGVRK